MERSKIETHCEDYQGNPITVTDVTVRITDKGRLALEEEMKLYDQEFYGK